MILTGIDYAAKIVPFYCHCLGSYLPREACALSNLIVCVSCSGNNNICLARIGATSAVNRIAEGYGIVTEKSIRGGSHSLNTVIYEAGLRVAVNRPGKINRVRFYFPIYRGCSAESIVFILSRKRCFGNVCFNIFLFTVGKRKIYGFTRYNVTENYGYLISVIVIYKFRSACERICFVCVCFVRYLPGRNCDRTLSYTVIAREGRGERIVCAGEVYRGYAYRIASCIGCIVNKREFSVFNSTRACSCFKLLKSELTKVFLGNSVDVKTELLTVSVINERRSLLGNCKQLRIYNKAVCSRCQSIVVKQNIASAYKAVYICGIRTGVNT